MALLLTCVIATPETVLSQAESASPGPVASAVASPDPDALGPLDLTAIPADDLRVVARIGPKGGTIEATGRDGSRFELTIPENVLPMPMSIAMTPLDDLIGFPAEATPEHHVGVRLEPDGLELASPATLTITIAGELPRTGVIAMDHRGSGTDAGFHLFDQGARSITLAIDHFSGYTAEFQLQVDQIRLVAEYERRDPADVLAHEVAVMIALQRQNQLLGIDDPATNLELARHFLDLFLEIVLKPRVAVAGRGCREAEDAMAALLSYQRQRQNLGVGDDPTFDIGAGTLVPANLVDLAVRLCFREAHARCVRTGAFPTLMATIFSFFARNENMLGLPPTAAQLELAHGYLRRCGRYHLEMRTRDQETDMAFHSSRSWDFATDIDLEWRPGGGLYGLIGSTIEGDGESEIAISDVDWRSICSKPMTVSRQRTDEPATARITSMIFDDVFGPTLTGVPLAPEPRQLVLAYGFGIVSFITGCPDATRSRVQEYLLWASEAMGQMERGLVAQSVRVADGWTFTVAPFTARRTFTGHPGGIFGGESHDTRVEFTLTHEPT